MRQVFLQKPWIYEKEPPEIADIFFKYGQLERLKRGTPLRNGGEDGKIYYLKKGLAAFSFQDKQGRSFVFALVPPGRVLADIDGISRELVNVYDFVIRPSEVLSINQATWMKYIGRNAGLLLKVMRGVISKHESHMEAMIANYTLSVSDRLKALFKAMLTSFDTPIVELNRLPIALSLIEYSMLLGASRVSISRTVNGWIKDGLVKKEKRDLLVSSELLADVYDWTKEKTNLRTDRIYM